jgi:phage antirepressor YoqD-like protein
MPTLPSKTQIALTFGGNDANAPLTMSSLEISELTGKRHDHVIRDIRAMLDALKDAPDLGDGSVLSHVREDKDARGYTAMFHLNRELTDTLLTGYSIPLRRKVVARWHELEAKLAQPVQPPVALPDLSTDEGKLLMIQDLATKQLALLADNKRIATELAITAPKAQALDRIAKAEGELCITDTAKLIQVSPRRLFAWMQLYHWIFRRGGKWVAYQDRIDSGHLIHRVTVVPRKDGADREVISVMVTAKGQVKLAQAAVA